MKKTSDYNKIVKDAHLMDYAARKEYKVKRIQENKEKTAERQAKYNQENKEKIAEYQSKYRQEKKEKHQTGRINNVRN